MTSASPAQAATAAALTRRCNAQYTGPLNMGKESSHSVASPIRALLVVDVQQGYFSQSEAVITSFPHFKANVTEALRLARTPLLPTSPASTGRFAFPLIVHIRAAYGLEKGSAFIPEFERMNPDKKIVPKGSPGYAVEPFARAVCESAGFRDALAEHRDSSGERSDFQGARDGPTEVVIDKPTFDAFLHTGLDAVLRAHGVTELFVLGLVTSACVQHTAHGAFARGYRTVLLEDCVGDRSRARHEATLALYAGYMYEVATLQDLRLVVAGNGWCEGSSESVAPTARKRSDLDSSRQASEAGGDPKRAHRIGGSSVADEEASAEAGNGSAMPLKS